MPAQPSPVLSPSRAAITLACNALRCANPSRISRCSRSIFSPSGSWSSAPTATLRHSDQESGRIRCLRFDQDQPTQRTPPLRRIRQPPSRPARRGRCWRSESIRWREVLVCAVCHVPKLAGINEQDLAVPITLRPLRAHLARRLVLRQQNAQTHRTPYCRTTGRAGPRCTPPGRPRSNSFGSHPRRISEDREPFARTVSAMVPVGLRW